MPLNDFRYGWRYTDEECSEEELSEIKILSEDISNNMWNKICDNKIIEKSSYIQKILSKELPVLIRNCRWGEEDEKLTGNLFSDYFKESEKVITILYDYESSIEIPSDLFFEKWFVFCYPSDSLIIKCGDLNLFYYEDIVYIV